MAYRIGFLILGCCAFMGCTDSGRELSTRERMGPAFINGLDACARDGRPLSAQQAELFMGHPEMKVGIQGLPDVARMHDPSAEAAAELKSDVSQVVARAKESGRWASPDGHIDETRVTIWVYDVSHPTIVRFRPCGLFAQTQSLSLSMCVVLYDDQVVGCTFF